MIPTASNRNKQDKTDDDNNKVVAVDSSDEKGNTLTNEETLIK